jgi:uncharacterized protein (DUF488 family)
MKQSSTRVEAVLPPIWTVGHSTKTADDFHALLLAHDVKTLVDVRSFPGSRRFPHFNKDELSSFLLSKQIDYRHLPALGGRRRGRVDSVNTGLSNPSFRAYADHMETEEFKQGVDELGVLAVQERTAIMCAEALWWRCHRSLIADYFKSRGSVVTHILDVAKTEIHPYTTAAKIVDGKLSYRGLFVD